MRKLIVLLAGLLTIAPIPAQYYPYPRVRRSTSRTTGIPGENPSVAGTLHGTLKQLTKKEIIIENEEQQDVVIRRTKKTKFIRDGKEIKATDLTLASLVSVDVVPDVDLKPMAVAVAAEPGKQPATAAR